MASRPGEEVAATLFADVHYYYGPPTAKPAHHRFDKGSYIYLLENGQQRRARLEIANNAGTPDQDAFDGYIDNTHIEYSFTHSTLVTLTVDGSGRPAEIDTNQWHLPTFDPKNENKYLYRLHTIDMYFYTKEDAQLFVSCIRRVLPQNQLNIQDEPGRPVSHAEPMSPLVQSLENVAITDPSYQDGRTRDSRSSHNSSQPTTSGAWYAQGPSSSSPSFAGPPSAAPSFPGPPAPALSFPGPPKASSPEPAPAPMAYNPAAPAAPETIIHREKTPPPEDGASNPLMMAAAVDQGRHYHTQQPQQSGGYPSAHSGGGYFPGPPQAGSANSPYSPASLPPPPAISPPVQQNPYIQSTGFTPQQSQQQQQHYPQYAGHPTSPGFQQPLASPGFQSPMQSPPIFTGSPHSQPAPTPPATTSPPVGGYSNFNYGRTQSMPVNQYDVHSQVYRPTEAEGKVKHHELPKNQRGKLEDSAVKVEKGVTSFLKKLEKKYG